MFRGGTFGPPFWYGNVVAYRVDGESRVAWSQLYIVRSLGIAIATL